jgi:aerobic-type carbon monoxide dehydrogenase small subunit (CoxS/CutS family)
MPEHSDAFSRQVRVTINGREAMVSSESTVAAAILAADECAFRRSVSGEPRGPLCGMGVCMECRVRINGAPHQKSCQILCRPNMEVITE